MSKTKYTATHPVKGKRAVCYLDGAAVVFAPGWRVWVPRRFPKDQITDLQLATD